MHAAARTHVHYALFCMRFVLSFVLPYLNFLLLIFLVSQFFNMRTKKIKNKNGVQAAAYAHGEKENTEGKGKAKEHATSRNKDTSKRRTK